MFAITPTVERIKLKERTVTATFGAIKGVARLETQSFYNRFAIADAFAVTPIMRRRGGVLVLESVAFVCRTFVIIYVGNAERFVLSVAA